MFNVKRIWGEKKYFVKKLYIYGLIWKKCLYDEMFIWWNVYVMKGKMKGIYLCFLFWNIIIGLILSCI